MKVLLVVVDAASPRVLCPAVQTGRLKHLQRLADAGDMHPASVSIFPSITPAATASIITGCYPSQHGIVGASWYDERSEQVAYYGDDFWVVAARGFGPFLRDFLVHLNGDRLTAPTLFESVERAGRDAACFADNDYRSHEVGPVGALPVLDRVDAALGAMFDAAGGIERFLAGTCVLVTSDHGHCDILADADDAVIHLDDVFEGFARATLGEPWRTGDEIMICPNMRAAQVYVHPSTAPVSGGRTRVVQAALQEPRIDLVIWRSGATPAARRYHVAGPRGTLAFWRHGTGGREGRDAHGTAWRWDGDPGVLRLEVCGGVIQSADYPNPFERIAGALDADAAGDVWLTAQPGCEFDVRGGQPHVGAGSHGALHVLDSLSPVICAGAPARLPRALRSIDLAAVCMRALGLPPQRGIGAPALRD